MRLAAVAVSFVVLAFASYWPAKLRAQRLHADIAAPMPVATEVGTREPGGGPAPVAGVTLPAVAVTPSSPATSTISRPSTHRAKRRHRDGNYLLDPFKR
jgi:hypothetical protein